MPLCNRVTPFGAIAALPGRGLFVGNRGILHDEQRRIVRQWQVRRWLACVLHVPGRRRILMQPHRWTELFFLDEAAAFAAGHRPCFECRRSDYVRFTTLWAATRGGSTRADDIDAVLHAERLDKRVKRTYRANISSLPDGSFVAVDGAAWLVLGDRLRAWSDAGYAAEQARPAHAEVDVLTPRSIVAILAAGYAPLLHPTAG